MTYRLVQFEGNVTQNFNGSEVFLDTDNSLVKISTVEEYEGTVFMEVRYDDPVSIGVYLQMDFSIVI